MQQDLNSVQAYNNIFKHIRSISQVRLGLACHIRPACLPPHWMTNMSHHNN
jgi:hypothetical protein